MFTSTIAAYALSAAWEVGLLDEVEQSNALDIDDFAQRSDLHKTSVRAIIDTLASRDILIINEFGEVSSGPKFSEMYEAKGFFYWLTRGCGQLFSSLPSLIDNSQRDGDFFKRDLRAVGISTRDMGRYFFDEPLRELLDDLTFETVADIGCGSGERLIRMTSELPDSHGVGIDISASALQLATEAIKAADLEERIALVRADARHISKLRMFKDVDLVTCFLMGHDLWPRESCVDSLQRIKRAFPHVQNFVLCDTYRSDSLPCSQPTLFTPGFEMAHAVMGVELPTLTDWLDVFDDGGWKCLEQRDIVTPSFTSMFVLAPT